MIHVSSGFTSNRIDAVTVAIVGRAQAAAARVRHTVAEVARARAKVASGEMRDSIAETADGVVCRSPHGGFVERGTVRMPAQPFMAPAAEIGRAVLPTEVSVAVKEASV